MIYSTIPLFDYQNTKVDNTANPFEFELKRENDRQDSSSIMRSLINGSSDACSCFLFTFFKASSQTSLIEWSSSVSKVTTMTKVLVQRKPKASKEFEAKTTHVAVQVWGVLCLKTYLILILVSFDFLRLLWVQKYL